ncbi:hypothetical protein BJF92_13780 [Rhizobium rhizosphaerae]|uniref:Uncharacterized protein n=2 Tax=Xaviernesmea rhizosphaerae TaxID=1672749 RepID=A0A1Q9AHY9_9HYPH|nr:hypothetical protein BJF92_13780 [Xaviernesmea rhizosphaerae]
MAAQKGRKPTQKEFEAIFGSSQMGSLARVVWPWYYWWMRYEIAKAKTPKDIAVVNAVHRAHQFWCTCGLVLGAPVVLVIAFLMMGR